MKIRCISIIGIVAIIGVLLAGLHLTARHLFLERFTEIEARTLRTNLLRARYALDNQLRVMDTMVKDWGIWDDSYQFVQGNHPGYEKANLQPEALKSLNIDLLAIIDRSGRTVFQGQYDPQTATILPATPALDEVRTYDRILLARSDDAHVRGFLSIGGRPFLVTTQSILRSDRGGPWAGTLIMGRWASANLQQELTRETQIDLTLALADLSATRHADQMQDAAVATTAERISATETILDLSDRPLLTLSVSMERDIIREGNATVRLHLFILVIFGVTFTILAVFILDRKVLSRLTTLTDQVTRVRTCKEGLVSVDGKDELGVLQSGINELLLATRASEASYETFFQNSGTANAVFDETGLILLVNTEFERMSGRSRQELEQRENICTLLPAQDESGASCHHYITRQTASATSEFIFTGTTTLHVLAAFSQLPNSRRIILALQDISALKGTQQELTELSRYLEARVEDRTRDLSEVNLRLAEEITQRRRASRMLEVLNGISVALSSTDATDTAFQQLLRVLCSLDPIDCGTVYIHDEDQNGFTLAAAQGLPASLPDEVRHLPMHAPQVQRATELMPVFGEYSEYEIQIGNAYADIGLRAIGMLPIAFHGTVVAILHVGSRSADLFPELVQSILRNVAAQSGGAIVRIRAQEASQRTALEMEAIFENSAVGIAHLAPNRIILKANHRLAAMFGYERHELIGQHISILHEDADASEEFAARHYPRLYNHNQIVHLEYRMRTRDGEMRWFSFNGRMIDAAAPERGFVWVLEDIQESKESSEALTKYMDELQVARDMQEENAARLVELVEELEQSKVQAESASKMKSDFLANVSHEIRTPMNAIMGMTDIVLGTSVTQEQRRALSIVKHSAEALLDLINGILDLSKIEAGQFELEIRTFALRPLLESAVVTLGLTATEKGIDLIGHIPPDMPREVLGDPARLRQVLINLMGNAVKFTPSGHVRCHLSIDEEDEDHYLVHFCVEDTGIGIPPAKQETIFDDFTQVDSSSTRVYGGTGLGLSISRKLVELMHGSIWVRSTQGQGSTFHFTARLGKVSGPDTTHAGIFDGAATVLVVINNTHLNAMVMELLQFWGLETIPATCFELTDAERPFDLAILDTDFNDYDCLDLLGTEGKLHDIPCLLISQINDRTAMERASQIRAVLTKPLLQDELLRALGNLFNVRVHLPEADAALQPAQSMRHLDILLVEDVATNRELAELVLGRMGHTVHDARDGLDALTVLCKRTYDLIFMDLQMPVMDGFTATQVIRACERGHSTPKDMDDSFLVKELREAIADTHTPIVAMTAHAMLQDRQRCLDIGMDGYLTKPLRMDEVTAVLAAIAAPEITPQTLPASASDPSSEGDVPESAASATGFVQRMISGLAARYELDTEQALGLITNLAETLPGHLAELEASMQREDTEGLRQHAHAIKGLLLNMDLTSEGARAKELEDLSKDRATSDLLAQATRKLADLCRDILLDIHATLSTNPEEHS